MDCASTAAVPLDEALPQVRAVLLRFYRRRARDLPWRKTGDPYAIWISEIMCQQTQVDTAVPRYGQFLQEFPTVETLAAASEQRVCEAWAGLGYYQRARNLHRAARRVRDEHEGELPRSAAVLMALPGIGRYTAGAIASIAFGEEAPVVDGNVVRVLTRMCAIEQPIESGAVRRRLWDIAAALVRGKDPGRLNQALMELGALVCKPARPECGRCPVSRWCLAAEAGTAQAYPVSAPKPPKQRMHVAFAWLNTQAGTWLERRPRDGLWAGLWELPSANGGRAKAALAKRLGVSLGRPVASVTHLLSHREVRARVYRAADPPAGLHERGEDGFRPFADPLSAPLSALARKAIEAAAEARGS